MRTVRISLVLAILSMTQPCWIQSSAAKAQDPIRVAIATGTEARIVADLKLSASDEDSRKRYGSLSELLRADARLNSAKVPYERVSDEVVDCRFFPGCRMRRIGVTFVSQLYRGQPMSSWSTATNCATRLSVRTLWKWVDRVNTSHMRRSGRTIPRLECLRKRK